MAKIKRKGTSGQAKNFITRTQAVRKLQMTLPDFRRLCIFKGIYPREPRNIKKASKSANHSTTFYYTKDIQYLLHEPLLAKFREQKALQKKIARSLGRNEVGDAIRLEKHGMPKITLDHIVRERYPTFIDALRDLDDALSLLFLFANLPSTSTVPAKVIARCQRLCHEFEHYLISTNSLRKSFLSIKGIYYQATIQGQDIMWLVPYRFVQNVSGDVDYRIMGTFVDFYTTLLGFVNFRLYTSIGLVYPPKFDAKKDDEGAELGAFTLEGRQVGAPVEDNSSAPAITNGHDQIRNTEEVQANLNTLVRNDQPQQTSDQLMEEDGEAVTADVIDKFEPCAPNGDYLPQPELSSNEAAALFSKLTFFISREAPRHPVEFLLRAFGCRRVAWDTVLGEGAFTHDESDSRITHQVVDRPLLMEATVPPESDSESNAGRNGVSTIRPGMYVPGRTYVQPQWVWDCVNEGQLLPSHLYAPGATLPPHLSPWIKPTKGQYDPRSSLAEQEADGEVGLLNKTVEGKETDDKQEADDEEEAFEDDSVVNGDMDVTYDDESGEEGASNSLIPLEDDFAGFREDGNDEPDSADDVGMERVDHQQDLEAEAAGLPFSTQRSKKVGAKGEAVLKKRQREMKEQRELDRQKMMMSRKKRKLFEKMQYSNNQKDAEAERLRTKRRNIERGHA